MLRGRDHSHVLKPDQRVCTLHAYEVGLVYADTFDYTIQIALGLHLIRSLPLLESSGLSHKANG